MEKDMETVSANLRIGLPYQYLHYDMSSFSPKGIVKAERDLPVDRLRLDLTSGAPSPQRFDNTESQPAPV